MHYSAAFTLLAELDTAEGEVFARVRGAYSPHLTATRGLPVSLTKAVIRFGTGKDLSRVGAGTSDERVTAEVFADASPAVAVLRFLRHTGGDGNMAYLRSMAELTALLDRHLGADPRAWSRLLALLPDCQGTVADLVAAAAAGEGGTAAIPAPPRTVAAEWRQLLLFASPAHLAALVPHLRPRVVLDLLHFGARLPGPVVTEVVRRATPRQRLALAAAEHAGPDAFAALIALADSEVNAVVYANPKVGDLERNRIMAAAGAVPLAPALVERATLSNNARYRRPGLWSGDPTLVRAALLRVQRTNLDVAKCVELWERGGVEALRPHFRDAYRHTRYEPFVVPLHRGILLGALLGLWDRHGPAAAESLVDDLPLRPTVAAKLRATLALGEAGRARMRADCDRTLAKPWPKSDLPRVPQGFRIGAPTYPEAAWEAMGAAHDREPLDGPTARFLTGFPGCPEVFVEAAGGGDVLRAQWPAATGWRTRLPIVDGYETRRLRTELERIPGLAERVFTGGLSAGSALELYERIQRYAPDPALRAAHGARMSAYIRERLGDAVEARVIAAQMAPSFGGTLPELFATAAAAAG
ncbi:hypothetical protein [Embleya sp. NBC_00896]|uniref:hypothetical protein n=1 Tax=Embleya sp. NBC_00896 TaxID=2975961 RepID=UPI003867E867|nr:hypothetical protein OG928_11890 [Embleya sp. NBC_00896]